MVELRDAHAAATPRWQRPLLFSDLVQAWDYRDVILKYSWVDIRSRFDRTFLGPLWVVVTTMLWVGTVGVVMTQLFKQDLATQLPYLAFGVFAWQFLSATVLEASSAFVSQKQFITAYKLPLMFFALRVVVRNFIVLSILTSIGLLLAVYFGLLQWQMIQHLPLVLSIYVFLAVPIVTILGSVGARFLDTSPFLVILMNIMMLVSPIFWKKDLLPAGSLIALLNPMVPLLDLYRELFLAGGANRDVYTYCIVLGVLLWVVATVVFQISAHRVRNWL